MWKRISYRPGQAVVLLLLAALITACAAFAPLYDRAVQQAVLLTRLSHTPVQVSGLRIASRGREQATALDFSALAALVPKQARTSLRTPVPSTTVRFVKQPDGPSARTGDLRWRQGECDHVVFTAGRCPSGAREVAVSAADTRNYGFHPGQRVRVHERVVESTRERADAESPVLTVVGVYRLQDGPYWYGDPPTGRSGTKDPDSSSPLFARPLVDDWLVAESTVLGPDAPWSDPFDEIDLPLDRSTVGVDRIRALGPVVEAFTRAPVRIDPDDPSGGGAAVQAYSGLPDLATDVDQGRRQAQVTIPLLMAQLGLLAVVVLWLVLGATTEQRRPEVAVARLRGSGVAGARRLVMAELTVVVLAGVPVGAAAALGLSFLARHLWLPITPPFEVRLGFWLSVLAAAVLLLVVTVAAAQRVAREPVADLLRRVPARRTGWALGVLDAVVISGAGALVVAFATGGLRGPIALVAPALLALVVGLVVAHVLVPVAAALGRRLLLRGRYAAGVSALQIARRPATRRVVAILTVATALLVFSADAVMVGQRNRAYAAEQQVGAPLTADLDTTDLVAVRAAMKAVDPGGRQVTPVAMLRPPGEGGSTTLAVDPGSFARIALFPGQPVTPRAWAALDPPAVVPIRLVGTSLSVHVSSEYGRVDRGRLDPLTPVRLVLQLVSPDGRRMPVGLGNLQSQRGRPRTLHALVSCRQGCRLTGVDLPTSSLRPVLGRVTLRGLRTSTGQRVRLGPGRDWRGQSTERHVLGATTSGDGLAVTFVDPDDDRVLTHVSVPERLPALVSGPLPVGSRGSRFTAGGLDGIIRPMVRVGTLERVPGAPSRTAVVNLDVLGRDGGQVDAVTGLQAWFARDDPALLARLRTQLGKRGVTVSQTSRLASVRRDLDDSAAAWSLQLAVLAGAAGLLVGALVLLVVTATTWRLRTRDFAGLRMSGVPRSRVLLIAVGEQLPVVVLAVLLGAVSGVVGAHFALPTVPLFATAPQVSTLDLSTAWFAVVIATAVALVLLAGLGWVAGRSVSRRSSLQRVRETL